MRCILFLTASLILLNLSCKVTDTRIAAPPYSAIATKGTSREQLLSAFKQLPQMPNEPAVFWTQIANDPQYPAYQRRLCVLQLFRRHVRSGMTLSEIGRILDSPMWLKREDIYFVKMVLGQTPWILEAENETFSILVLPEDGQDTSAVYIKTQGNMDSEVLCQILREQKGSREAKGRHLLQFVVSE